MAGTDTAVKAQEAFKFNSNMLPNGDLIKEATMLVLNWRDQRQGCWWFLKRCDLLPVLIQLIEMVNNFPLVLPNSTTGVFLLGPPFKKKRQFPKTVDTRQLLHNRLPYWLPCLHPTAAVWWERDDWTLGLGLKTRFTSYLVCYLGQNS